MLTIRDAKWHVGLEKSEVPCMNCGVEESGRWHMLVATRRNAWVLCDGCWEENLVADGCQGFDIIEIQDVPENMTLVVSER